jgi:hypothetical protein
MPIYQFIAKAPHGKEVRGECRAKNLEDLASILGDTGLAIKWCQEKGGTDAATRALAMQVADVLKTMDASGALHKKRSLKNPANYIPLAVLTLGIAASLYYYLDSRIKKLESLQFEPTIVRNFQHQNEELAQ